MKTLEEYRQNNVVFALLTSAFFFIAVFPLNAEYVFDNANVLSSSDEANLEAICSDLMEQLGIDFIVVTKNESETKYRSRGSLYRLYCYNDGDGLITFKLDASFDVSGFSGTTDYGTDYFSDLGEHLVTLKKIRQRITEKYYQSHGLYYACAATILTCADQFEKDIYLAGDPEEFVWYSPPFMLMTNPLTVIIGGAGFLLIFVSPQVRKGIKEKLSNAGNAKYSPFGFGEMFDD